jgi:hypothetical protein
VTATKRFVIKECCRARAICGRVQELEALPEGESSNWTGGIVDVVEVPSVRPRYNVCYTTAHEAAHAVVGHALGAKLIHVDADDLLRVRHENGGLSWRARAIIWLAGDHGATAQMRHDPWVEPLTDEAVLDYIGAVRSLEFGWCDNCAALFSVRAIIGYDAPDHVHLAEFRAIEQQTFEIVQRREIVQAVRAVAEHLLDIGPLEGSTAHALIATNGVPFGSIVID